MAVAEPPIAIVESTPAAPPPAPKTSINVTVPTTPATPPPPVKPGTRREQMHEALAKKAAPQQPQSKPPEVPKAEPKSEPKADKAETEVPAAKEEPAKEAGKEKVSPWKLVDQYKNRAAELEKQLADAKTAGVPEEERKAISERIEKAEKRAKELEDEIRFVNYEKSQEFQTKYQEPYQKAWANATAELAEITLTDPNTQQVRVAAPEDLLTLVNLPLGKAREIADSVFGNFADDVMAHRKEIKNLFQVRQSALEEARKTGAEREKKMAEEQGKQSTERNNAVKQAWEKANQEALAHEKYGPHFVPVEGDQEGNQRLAKGFELVDRAFTENPLDPNLNAEQRASIIKRHAAVRNRAAAFGRLVHRNEQLSAKIAELSKELEGYKSSEPDTAGTQQKTTTAPIHTSARGRLEAAIGKYAKPS